MTRFILILATVFMVITPILFVSPFVYLSSDKKIEHVKKELAENFDHEIATDVSLYPYLFGHNLSQFKKAEAYNVIRLKPDGNWQWSYEWTCCYDKEIADGTYDMKLDGLKFISGFYKGETDYLPYRVLN